MKAPATRITPLPGLFTAPALFLHARTLHVALLVAQHLQQHLVGHLDNARGIDDDHRVVALVHLRQHRLRRVLGHASREPGVVLRQLLHLLLLVRLGVVLGRRPRVVLHLLQELGVGAKHLRVGSGRMECAGIEGA